MAGHQVIHLSDEADANLRVLCEQLRRTRTSIVEELIRAAVPKKPRHVVGCAADSGCGPCDCPVQEPPC